MNELKLNRFKTRPKEKWQPRLDVLSACVQYRLILLTDLLCLSFFYFVRKFASCANMVSDFFSNVLPVMQASKGPIAGNQIATGFLNLFIKILP